MTDEKAALDGLLAVCRLLAAAGMSDDAINDLLDRAVCKAHAAVPQITMGDVEAAQLGQLLAAAAIAAPTWEECIDTQVRLLEEIGRDLLRRGFSGEAAKDAFTRICAAGRQAGEQMAQRGMSAGSA